MKVVSLLLRKFLAEGTLFTMLVCEVVSVVINNYHGNTESINGDMCVHLGSISGSYRNGTHFKSWFRSRYFTAIKMPEKFPRRLGRLSFSGREL